MIDKVVTDTMSNSILARLFSIEFLLWAAGTLVALGMTYSSLNSAIANAQEVATNNKMELEIVRSDIGQIKTSIAVIQHEQTNANDSREELKDDMDEQRGDIKQILRLLEQRASESGDH